MALVEPRRRGGALLARYRLAAGENAEPWRLRLLPVCGSTELMLSRWLQDLPATDQHPRAILAGHQTRATGQRGRPWLSPIGGVWLSAALPWATRPSASAGLLGLAVAVALAERLERRGLPVQVKWPNDLLVNGCKLAGLLPRLVHRGARLRQVRVGLGLNVTNAVPVGATSLRRLLGPGHGGVRDWGGEVLLALDQCLRRAGDSTWCVSGVEDRLWSDRVTDPVDGLAWRIEGVAADGGLRLRHGMKTCIWRRWP